MSKANAQSSKLINYIASAIDIKWLQAQGKPQLKQRGGMTRHHRYVPYITQQMAVAEANCQSLRRLLGELDRSHTLHATLFTYNNHQDKATQLEFTIVEQFCPTPCLWLYNWVT